MKQMPKQKGDVPTFAETVFPAEMETILARREAAEALFGRKEERRIHSPFAPTTKHGLVGLALSGGGIRSAAFNLGVLQALHRRAILPQVDYLSTVSGGGWIGSALQALLSDAAATKHVRFPFEAPAEANVPATGDGSALGYLRARADTLVKLGFGGGVRAMALLVRSQILTWSLLLPVVMFLVCISSPVMVWYLNWTVRSHQGQPTDAAGTLPWHWFTEASRYPLGAAVVWMVASMAAVSLVNPEPKLRRWLEGGATWALAGALVCAAVELQIYVSLRWYLGVMYPRDQHAVDWSAVLKGPVAAITTLYALAQGASLVRRLARPAMLAAALIVSVLVPYVVYLIAVSMFFRRYLAAGGKWWVQDALWPEAWPWFLLAAVLVAVGLHANAVSMHRFYRDKLTEVFLVRQRLATDAAPTPEARFVPAETVRLSALNREGSWAPYALVNVALNLQGIEDGSLHGRGCDFFIFSRHFVGSERTGYCDTRRMEAVTSDLDLGTAMAVSGAAAAPNMGTYTTSSLVALMTFLNIRLGYWLPHPARVHERPTWLTRLRAYPFGLPCYVRELFSLIDDRGSLVFLTDGGHLENTGAYELLRRRCKVVIASDAEEDPRLEFGGLAALVRYARIHLRTEIEIDVRPLRLGATGYSNQHAVVGRIVYPREEGQESPEVGLLLYVKASVTDDEDVLIAEYRARNADFPHQSTADQVFDEAQFEAYRSLGQHAVEHLGGASAAGEAMSAEAWVRSLIPGGPAVPPPTPP